MQKKIEKEGEEQEEMFEKFVCYCEQNSKKLQDSVGPRARQPRRRPRWRVVASHRRELPAARILTELYREREEK